MNFLLHESLVQDQLLCYFIPCYQTITWALSEMMGPCSSFHIPELVGTAILTSWHSWMCALKLGSGCHVCLWMCGKHGRKAMLWSLHRRAVLVDLHPPLAHLQGQQKFPGGEQQRELQSSPLCCSIGVHETTTQFLASSCLSLSLPVAFIWELVALSPPCHHYKSEVRICWTVRDHYRAAQKLQADSTSFGDCYRFQCMETVFVRGTVQRTSKLFN